MTADGIENTEENLTRRTQDCSAKGLCHFRAIIRLAAPPVLLQAIIRLAAPPVLLRAHSAARARKLTPADFRPQCDRLPPYTCPVVRLRTLFLRIPAQSLVQPAKPIEAF